jgi:hypothetical protein
MSTGTGKWLRVADRGFKTPAEGARGELEVREGRTGRPSRQGRSS